MLAIDSKRRFRDPRISELLFLLICFFLLWIFGLRINYKYYLFQNPPWQILQVNETGGIIEYGGLTFDIIDELSRSLNFSFTVRLSKDDPLFYGNAEYDNSSSHTSRQNMEMSDKLLNVIPESIIKLVTSKTVAMAACGFTITEDKKAFVNFTDPISVQTYTFIVARPRELSRVLLFMSPFTYSVSATREAYRLCTINLVR